jgi:hypothetical protein
MPTKRKPAKPATARIERTPEDRKRFSADMERIGARMGRPSAISGKSASVTFRLTPALRGRLEARAKADGLSLSDTIAIVLAAGLDGSARAPLNQPQAAAQASALAGAAAVTDGQIETLRAEAAAAGDRAVVRTCDRALRGIAKDRAQAARILANNEANR